MINVATAAVAVLLLLLCELSTAQEYVITREDQDTFKIPASICNNNAEECNGMGANRLSDEDGNPINCGCQCNVDNTHNVFGFFDDTWKCERNSDVRTLAACLVLNGNTASSPLVVLRVTAGANWQWIGEVGNVGSNCKLQDQFSYLDCHGTWRQINNVGQGFDLTIETSSPLRYSIYYHDKAKFDRYKPTIYGRVIKLTIGCTTPRKYYCVVLKVHGQLTCPSKIPTPSPWISSSREGFSSSSSHIPLTTMATFVITSSIYSSQRLSTSTSSHTPSMTMATSVHTTSSSSSQLSSNIQSTLSKSSTMHPSFPPTTRTSTKVITKTTKLHNPTEPFLNDGKKSASTADNTSIIAGTVGGIVALLAIIAVVIIRKIKGKRNASTDRTGSEQTDNVYEEPPDIILAHTGQQLSNGKQHKNIYAVVEKHKDRATRQISDTSNRAYDHSPPIARPDAPVYSTLEAPDDMKPEPVYNVLEGPDMVGAAISHDAPVYDVLEGP